MDPDRRDADWRDAAAYAPLLQAERSVFAWEWLRRDPDYRAAANGWLERGFGERPCDGEGGPERWGLHVFEPPNLTAPEARPVWRAEVHPYVLGVRAEASPQTCDSLDLTRLRAGSRIVTAADGREHLLISDGLRALRLDVLAGSLRHGPVRLHYRLAGLASADRPLLTLRRLIGLCGLGRFPTSLHPPETRAKRFILMLRAHDAVLGGAAQREIAAVLLSAEAEEPRWRVDAPTLRSQVQRLVRTARRMAAGGYRSLLSD